MSSLVFRLCPLALFRLHNSAQHWIQRAFFSFFVTSVYTQMCRLMKDNLLKRHSGLVVQRKQISAHKTPFNLTYFISCNENYLCSALELKTHLCHLPNKHEQTDTLLRIPPIILNSRLHPYINPLSPYNVSGTLRHRQQ